MKKLFKLFAILAMFVGFVACEELTDEETATPGFSGFTSSELSQSVSNEGKNITFSFVADEAWNASVVYYNETGWVTITPNYGDPLLVTNMSIVVEENLSTEKRVAKIEVTSGVNQMEITITQSGVDDSGEDGGLEPDASVSSEFMLTAIAMYELEDGELDGDEAFYIEYDEQNRVSRFICDYGMVNCGDDGEYNYRKILTYTYGDSTITEHIEYDYAPADAQDDRIYIYTLNSDGFVASYEGAYDSNGTYTYSNGYLVGYNKPTDDESFELTWEDGVLTSISGIMQGYYYYDTTTGASGYTMEAISNKFTYGNVENLVNLDINVIIAMSAPAYCVFTDQSPLLMALGYMGARTSKYLLIQDNDITGYDVYEYTYEFNDNGTPSQVTIMCDEEDDDLYVIKFAYGSN